MKKCLLVFITLVTILIPISMADSWETYGKNITANNANLDTTGHFNRTMAFFNLSFGMDFQPLVSDLDSDGYNELIIWQNDTLRIYNKSIAQIVEYKLGVLRSQPSISNFTKNTKSIVAIQETNFTVINFNGSISIVKNFNLTWNLTNSGLMCGLIDNDTLEDCVFKDNEGYLHMFDNNSNSQSDDKLNVYVGNNSERETNFSIVSIADFDNDGRNEILVRHTKLVTVVDSVTKNIELTHDLSQDYGYRPIGQFPINPLFFDADKDRFHELLLAYPILFSAPLGLDDGISYLVLNYTGSVKWQHNCSFDASTTISTTARGSRPVPIDTLDSVNTELILVCGYNSINSNSRYSLSLGINIIDGLNGTIYQSTNHTFGFIFTAGNESTAVADINNNGILDILLPDGAYEISSIQNKTFDYNGLSASFLNPVVVDIDGNKALDIILSSNGLTYIFLDNASYYNDLEISSSDISYFRINGSSINVSVNVHNLGSVNAFNINVTVGNLNSNEEASSLFNLTQDITAISFVMGNFSDGDKIIALVDASGIFNESDENNNFAESVFKAVSVYLDIRLPYGLNNTFEEYLKSKFNEYNFVNNPDNADIVISVGKQAGSVVKYNDFIFNTYDFGILDGIVTYQGNLQNEPYVALIAGYENNSRKYVFILGNEIEGEIAGAITINSEIIDNMLNTYLDRYNEEGIATYEYLHSSLNKQYYATDTNEFKSIVKTALNGRFDVENYTVYTNDNVSLRLIKIGSLNSDSFRNMSNKTIPIILARGLWSNINTWKDFGEELANSGSEVWLIEITGGPGTECDTCIDYTFDNLTDSYFPALIAGVQYLTNKSKLNYVGFSNGCRTALSSLDKYNNIGLNNIGKIYIDNTWINVNMSAFPINTFVGVGCPGAFNSSDPYGRGVVYSSEVGNALNVFGGTILRNLRNSNVSHTTLRVAARSIRPLSLGFKNVGNKISVTLLEKYYNFSSKDDDTQPAQNFTINKFGIIEGDRFVTSDFVVFVSDEKQIYDNVNSTDKIYLRIYESHGGISEDTKTKRLIKNILFNQSFTNFEELFNIKERIP